MLKLSGTANIAKQKAKANTANVTPAIENQIHFYQAGHCRRRT
jgi:hypothetical protein